MREICYPVLVECSNPLEEYEDFGTLSIPEADSPNYIDMGDWKAVAVLRYPDSGHLDLPLYRLDPIDRVFLVSADEAETVFDMHAFQPCLEMEPRRFALNDDSLVVLNEAGLESLDPA